MYTVTHLLLALMISSLLRTKFFRRTLFLFSLGAFLPDLDHIYMHRYLLHNVFFLAVCLAISRALGLGATFHLLGDFLASDLNTLLYPITLIDVGLRLWWLYSAWFNLAIAVIFASVLMLREGMILKHRSLQDIIRFALMVLASMSFASAKASEILLGYVNPILVEGARFAGVAILLIAYFKRRGGDEGHIVQDLTH